MKFHYLYANSPINLKSVIMKKLIFITLLTACFLQSFAIQRVSFTDGAVLTNAADEPTPIRSVENVDDGMIVTYNFSGATLSYDNLFPGTVTFDIVGFQVSSTPGEPALPRRVDSFLVPIGSDPVVLLLACEYKDLPYEIAPARFPIGDSDTTKYSTANIIPVKPFSGFFPDVICEQLPDGLYRSQPIAQIKVSPIQYDFYNKSVRVYSKLVYKIKYSGTEMASGAYYEPGSLLNPNCEIALPMAATTFSSTNAISVDAGYLIISVPEFEDALAPFVRWKQQLGYTVTTLYNSAWTPELIKEAVQEQYIKDKSLQYLLIVGDHSKVPADTFVRKRIIGSSVTESKYISDFSYGCIDGTNDILPDIFRGRWPMRNAYDVSVIVHKSMGYELGPVIEADFYKNAVHFGYFQDEGYVVNENDTIFVKSGQPDGEEDRRFVKTCEDVGNYLTQSTNIAIDRVYYAELPHSARPVPSKWSSIYSSGDEIDESIYDKFYCSGKCREYLRKSINSGKLYMLYRGHGENDGWCINLGTDSTRFDIPYAEYLENYSYMPLIFSICCQTGNHSFADCFTNTLLKHRTGGTMAAYAQTNNGLSGHNDRLTSLFFNAIWPFPGFSLDKYPLDDYWAINNDLKSPIYQLGGILDFSINGIIPWNINDSSEELYTKRITHCFGDPSLSFTTEVPTTFDYVDIVQDDVANTVTVDIGNEPAYISFYNPVDGHSSRYFGTSASYKCSHHDHMKHLDITVSNHNKIPHLTLGQEYMGTLSPKNWSQITGWRDLQASRVEIEFIIADVDKNSKISMVIVDMSNGNIVAQTSIDKSIIDQKRTITLFSQTGVMMASLMVDGYPQSNVKMYISR